MPWSDCQQLTIGAGHFYDHDRVLDVDVNKYKTSRGEAFMSNTWLQAKVVEVERQQTWEEVDGR